MLAIFFPHLFEELEYLIPSDDALGVSPSATRNTPQLHAIAGPSRIPAQ